MSTCELTDKIKEIIANATQTTEVAIGDQFNALTEKQKTVMCLLVEDGVYLDRECLSYILGTSVSAISRMGNALEEMKLITNGAPLWLWHRIKGNTAFPLMRVYSEVRLLDYRSIDCFLKAKDPHHFQRVATALDIKV